MLSSLHSAVHNPLREENTAIKGIVAVKTVDATKKTEKDWEASLRPPASATETERRRTAAVAFLRRQS